MTFFKEKKSCLLYMISWPPQMSTFEKKSDMPFPCKQKSYCNYKVLCNAFYIWFIARCVILFFFCICPIKSFDGSTTLASHGDIINNTPKPWPQPAWNRTLHVSVTASLPAVFSGTRVQNSSLVVRKRFCLGMLVSSLGGKIALMGGTFDLWNPPFVWKITRYEVGIKHPPLLWVENLVSRPLGHLTPKKKTYAKIRSYSTCEQAKSRPLRVLISCNNTWTPLYIY